RRKNDLTAISMKLLGGNPHPRVSGTDELAGKTNYFIGKDPRKWLTGVPSYTAVGYKGVYPGIDLIYKGKQQELEYDFAVAPGADPKVIALRFGGAERIEIDTQGDLVLHT